MLKQLLSLILFIFVTNSSANVGTPRVVKFPFNMHKTVPSQYSDTIVSNVFSKVELKEVLQKFIDEVYGVGFLNFGGEKDSYHFHFIGDATPDNKRRIFALLYHTQEHVKTMSSDEKIEYSALDYKDRSWLQWVDTFNTENALRYVYSIAPQQILNNWNFFIAENTIKGFMLNPSYFNVKRVFDFGQITFYKTSCSNKDNVIVEVNNWDGAELCLKIESIINKNHIE